MKGTHMKRPYARHLQGLHRLGLSPGRRLADWLHPCRPTARIYVVAVLLLGWLGSAVPSLAQTAAPVVTATTTQPAVPANITKAINTAVAAATSNVPPAYNAGDTAWMLTSTALVMVMMPGLALYYGGIVRKKNWLATMWTSYVALGVITLQWFMFGYCLAFGHSVLGGFIGWSPNTLFLWKDFNAAGGGYVMDRMSSAPHTIPDLVFCMFQLMFAIITPALIAGSVAERVSFRGFVAFIFLWATFVYDPLAHAVWVPTGWLAHMGAVDFAGGTVVHISSGVAGLAFCLVLGKRIGYPKHVIQPNALGMTLTGAGLLWFGWYGFNAGSANAANNLACMAFTNTTIATAIGGLAWNFAEYLHHRRCTTLGMASGFVAGLVAITPACGYIQPWSAAVLGVMAGMVCYWGAQIKNIFGYDDALDAFGVHAVGGYMGAVMTGVFAAYATNSACRGWIMDGHFAQVGLQFLAASNAAIYSFVVSLILALVLDKTIGIRVPDHVEIQGLDIGVHGENGWDIGTLPEPAVSMIA